MIYAPTATTKPTADQTGDAAITLKPTAALVSPSTKAAGRTRASTQAAFSEG